MLGVDERAKRKRRSDGTILVDLERHEPVDLLGDRTSVSLVTWLAAHHGVEIICCDRGKEYAEGGRQGAPEALQVADRWHLLLNLSETLERDLARTPRRLREVARYDARPAVSEPCDRGRAREQRARRDSRLQRDQTVRRLYCAGAPIAEIARILQMSRNTAAKYVRAEEFAERLPQSPGPARRLPNHDSRARRWQAGCHNARLLWEELRTLGYPGSIQPLQRYLLPWRLHPRREPSPLPSAALTPATAHRAARFFTRRGDGLTAEEQTYVERLRRLDPELDQVAERAEAFRCMVHDRDTDTLDDWIAAARGSGTEELVHFADQLQSDYAAVRAALSLPWSNGQTEGQITRLQRIKPQMYGRGKLDLLRLRVLHRG